MSEDAVRESLINSLKRRKLRQKLKVDLSVGIEARVKPSTHCEVDICFKTTGGKIIGIEVKDEVGYNEALKGIGQAVGYLQYCHGSYIAVPEEYGDDLIHAIKDKTNVGLIVYSGKSFKKSFKFRLAAEFSKPQNPDLISRFLSKTKYMWQTCERDNFLETVFERSEGYSGRVKKYGKYGFHLLMSSISNMMLMEEKSSHVEELENLTKNYYDPALYQDFYEKFENKWFSPQDIMNKSKSICRRRRKYGNHSKAIIQWRLPESVLMGIVEVKRREKKKFLYRINPMFLPKIYKLVKEWEKKT
jgi:hypothetical protein